MTTREPPAQRSTGVASRAMAVLLSLTTAIAVIPGCSDRARIETAADDDDDAVDGDDGGDAPERDGPAPTRDPAFPAYDLIVGAPTTPPLPDPGLFGIDPDPAHWAMPDRATTAAARGTAALDPRVHHLEIELEVRPSLDADRYVDFTLTLAAAGPDGEANGELPWAQLDTAEPGVAVGTASGALLKAMLDDTAAMPACADVLAANDGGEAEADAALDLAAAPDVQAGGPGPQAAWAGGQAWWARQLCPTQLDNYMIANVVALFSLALLQASLAEGAVVCEEIQVPAESQACTAAALRAEELIAFEARPAIQAAAQLATLSVVLVDQLRNMAAAARLGAPAGPPLWPLFAPATALTMITVGHAAIGRAGAARIAVIAASGAIYGIPQLFPQYEETLLDALPRVDNHREQLHFLIHCLERIARWIAMAGVIGFVALLIAALADEDDAHIDVLAAGGPLPGHGGPRIGIAPDVQADGPIVLDGSFTVLAGPLLPRANQFAAAEPLLFDIPSMPSYLAAQTLVDANGRTDRRISFGYADPQMTLTEDLWGLEEFTALPIPLASAGTPIVLEPGYIADGGDAEIVVEAGALRMRGTWFDLAAQQIDANGNPVELPWVCVGVNDACPLVLPTTGSPAQLAAHESITRHWRVTATSSIVDLESGEHIERAAGYVVTMSAPLERPADPCYDSFDEVEWKWIRNHMLPGCGPVMPGGGGEGGGGPGGGPGGGGGPALP